MAELMRDDVRRDGPAGAVAAGRGRPRQRARHAGRARAAGRASCSTATWTRRTRAASRGSPACAGFQPDPFVKDGPALRARHLEHEGRARLLRRGGARAAGRGRAARAATCSSRPSAARSRRRSGATRRAPSTAATRPARATSSRTAASPTCASSASRPSRSSCSATSGRSGCASRRAATSSTPRSARASATRTRSCACARCSTRCSSGSRRGRPTPRTRTAARRRSSASAAIQGGFGWRVSRTPHRTDLFLDVRVPPTKPMAAARGQVLDMARDLARRFPDYGVEAEVYVTAPGAEIDEGHPLVGAARRRARAGLRRAARAGRHALVLRRLRADPRRRPDDQLRHLDRPARHDRRREPRHRRPRQDGARLRSRGDGGLRGSRVKLVTYDDGKVGRVDGEEIVRLDVPDMRTYFERGGADDAGERTPLADATLRAPIVPKKFFHTAGNFREHEDESKNGRLVARDRAVDRLLPERRRDRRPRRAGRLSRAPDRGARLRARARRHPAASRASGSRPRRRPTTSAAT